MQISIFGTGYVGLVTGACLAESGNRVVCVDVDAAKVASLTLGKLPIYEPGLEDIVHRNQAAGTLRFTTDSADAVAHGDVIFIAVGTPPDEDGSADMRHVIQVADTIGMCLSRYVVVVNKSTVPVGTAERVRKAILAQLVKRGVEIDFDVVSNPEFLKEGDAVKDCMRPDRIVIGSLSPRAVEIVKKLYSPFNRNHERIVHMDERSAELTKYAANAMLATKISFMNEMSNIAENVGADIEMVRLGIGSDARIGFSFIYPGAGYGGSCFPKDVQALERMAKQNGYTPRMLQAVEAVNNAQKSKIFELINRHFSGEISGKTFAIWGLSFKPNTDDIREAPSRTLIELLWQRGARVQVFDPEAGREIKKHYGERSDLVVCSNQLSALKRASALILMTEWKCFWSLDLKILAQELADKVIFDGRNIYDPQAIERAGIAYYGIGRGRSVFNAGIDQCAAE